jgi:hypothetical protein
MAEAAIQFEKGLEGLSKLSESKRREEHELDLRAGLGPALIATKGWSAHKLDENYARATIVAEQLGRVDYLVPLQYGQWAFRLVRAEHKLALEHANELERMRFLLRRCRGILGMLSANRQVSELFGKWLHSTSPCVNFLE